MQYAIEVKNLGKIYHRRKRGKGFIQGIKSYFSPSMESFEAVKNLSFKIKRGESVGFIGENGAGKSTTIKMLTGILTPSSGEVFTLGHNPWQNRRQVAMNIGVVFGQKPQILWDIPAGESFKLLKSLYNIPDSVYDFTYKEAVARLELEELLKTPVRLLSLGQRMRCDLAASLIHAPAVAFLDEPTIGMDILVKERVREFILELRNKFGTTILLTTHDLKDISSTSERLLVLDKGRLLYDGSLKGFEKRFARERSIDAELASQPIKRLQNAVEKELKALNAKAQWEEGLRLKVICRKPGTAPKITGILLKRLQVLDLTLHGADIDSIVTKLYRKKEETKTKA